MLLGLKTALSLFEFVTVGAEQQQQQQNNNDNKITTTETQSSDMNNAFISICFWLLGNS